jgi:hypothetical protein
MRALRCCGPCCSILSKGTRLEYELDLLAGRCLCREAVERMDKGACGAARAPQSAHSGWIPEREREGSPLVLSV